MDWHQAKALLDWYVELGVSDAMSDEPINRYEVAPPPPKKTLPEAPHRGEAPRPAPVDWGARARELAGGAGSIDALAEAIRGFEGSPLKKGARSFVFADGVPTARVMVVGDAPNAEEDREGRPFVGAVGRLLDQMFAAIDMGRDAPDAARALYLTTPLPWKPTGQRAPTLDEIALFKPFLERHIMLAQPDVIVIMGNIALQALLGRQGITRARGSWETVLDRPALPMFHPSYLLKNPAAKREAWADLLELNAKLREGA